VRVALDVTPLLGAPTGVGAFVRGASTALAEAGTTVVGYGLTGRRRVGSHPGVQRGRSVPAALALAAWSRGAHWPDAEWLAGAADVVHGTNFVVPPARRATRVVTVHDLTAVRFPQLCTPTSRRYPAFVRRAAAEGAWIHTPSRFVAAEVCELLDVSPSRVRAVPHGVDHVKAAPRQPRQDILAIGTAEPRKDFPGLVRAFDRLASEHAAARLVLAGPEGWGGAALQEAIDRATHRERIVRIGYVDESERAELFAQAAVFAFPSIYEGFGLPPLEAMAAGVPVVTTDAGAVPEVVGDAAVVVPVGDEDALAGALADVLEHPDVAASLTARGHRRAAEYTWARCAAGLQALYEESMACA
jgi:glycosyltransferase involved in cell wall biosynthesis